MVFTATIDYKKLDNPYEKGRVYGGKVYHVGGPFENTLGSTGGVIDVGALLGGNKVTVIESGFTNSISANGIRVQDNVASAGQITITTTADDDGRWWAKVQSI